MRLDDKRLKAIARFIRENNGSVVAEQLRPLLDPKEEDALVTAGGGDYVSEQFMLPVLTRFDGYPEVTKDGNIV